MIQFVEGDDGSDYEKIIKDYWNGTRFESFQEYLNLRLRQSDDIEEIIKSEFLPGEHPLDKYLFGLFIDWIQYPNVLMRFTDQFNEETNTLGLRLPLKFEHFRNWEKVRREKIRK